MAEEEEGGAEEEGDGQPVHMEAERRALQLLTQAVSDATRVGLRDLVVSAQLDMIECYLALNRDVQASDLAYETVLTCERNGTPTEGAKAQVFAGLAQARMGNVERAAASLRASTPPK